MFRKKSQWARAVLECLRREYPDAGTMLVFGSQFELLVAVVLSAQSTDAQVNKVTGELFARFNTPEAFADMPIYDLEKRIQGVGLYRSKAKSIQTISKILIEKYAGLVPADLEKLMELPGIGRKSANVIMAVGFDRPGLGVDTHVQRVVNRIGIVAEKNPHKTEMALKGLIPPQDWNLAHHLFIFHGRKICKARRPMCDVCVIADMCLKLIQP